MPFRRIKQQKGILLVFELFSFFWTAGHISAFRSSCSVTDSARISGTTLCASVRRVGEVVYDGASNPFREHLAKCLSQVKAKNELVHNMDDDLKRMEMQFYNLSEPDAPKCRGERSGFSYNGPTTRPDTICYELVAQAYASANIGREGALLAEDVVRRFESHQEDGCCKMVD